MRKVTLVLLGTTLGVSSSHITYSPPVEKWEYAQYTSSKMTLGGASTLQSMWAAPLDPAVPKNAQVGGGTFAVASGDSRNQDLCKKLGWKVSGGGQVALFGAIGARGWELATEMRVPIGDDGAWTQVYHFKRRVQ